MTDDDVVQSLIGKVAVFAFGMFIALLIFPPVAPHLAVMGGAFSFVFALVVFAVVSMILSLNIAWPTFRSSGSNDEAESVTQTQTVNQTVTTTPSASTPSEGETTNEREDRPKTATERYLAGELKDSEFIEARNRELEEDEKNRTLGPDPDVEDAIDRELQQLREREREPERDESR